MSKDGHKSRVIPRSSGKATNQSLVSVEHIERSILFIRREKVMLDADLAFLYGVKTKVLDQAVKRNMKRFPSDFMFQLTKKESELLRSQIVTSSLGNLADTS